MTSFASASSSGAAHALAGFHTPRFEGEMRALRSQLQGLMESRHPTLLAVTACNRGDGTATVARELCSSLAMDGVKVLYCGAQRTAARDPFGRDSGPPAERQMVRRGSLFLCCVDISDLHSPKASVAAAVAFRQWLEQSKQHFDVIVTEVPPILTHPASGALMPIQDGVLLVMQAEQTRSTILKTTLTALTAAGGHVLGIVFNKRKRHIPGFFYRWL